jgi:hypothetical protein
VRKTAEVSGQVRQGVEQIVGQIARIGESARANADAAVGMIDEADRMSRLGDELNARLVQFQT